MELPIKVGHWYRRRDGKLVKAIRTPDTPFDCVTYPGEDTVNMRTGAAGYAPQGVDLVEHIAGPEWDEILQAVEDGKPLQWKDRMGSWVEGDRVGVLWDISNSAKLGYDGRARWRVAGTSDAHPHADLMSQYAEDAKKTAEPWKLWEYDIGTGWLACSEHPSFKAGCNYRRRPITRWVNVYSGPEATGNACESREAADACAKPGRIGLLRISGEEASFLYADNT